MQAKIENDNVSISYNKGLMIKFYPPPPKKKHTHTKKPQQHTVIHRIRNLFFADTENWRKHHIESLPMLPHFVSIDLLSVLLHILALLFERNKSELFN